MADAALTDFVVESSTDTPDEVAAVSGEKTQETPTDPPQPKEGEASEAADEKPAEAESEGESETPDKQVDSEGEEAEAEPPEKPKKKGGFQRRIDKLTREKREAEARAAELERKLADKPAAETADKPSTDKPVAESYDSYEEFLEALTDWKTDQRFEAQRKEDERKAAETAQQQRAAKVAELADAVREKYEDFDEVLETADDIQVSPGLRDALVESDNLPELQYHLAKHPEDVTRLNALTPLAAARELGKIEAKLTAAPAAEKPAPPKPKSTTKAPEPITPVGTASTKTTVPLEQADFEEYKRRRAAGET